MNPPTYPARPINGGPLDRALPKRGQWYVEPKYNGWRALVHAPSGTMWNRHGERLTIEKEFAGALALLRDNTHVAEWFDCEALERRHGIAKGSLIILDCVLPKLTYIERRAIAFGSEDPFRVGQLHHANTYLHTLIPNVPDSLFVTESYEGSEAAGLYADLKEANAKLGCEFYEGVVMKRADSTYPMQLRSADEKFAGWMKHRWKF